MLVSSAKSLVTDEISVVMSLINIKNKTGPRTEPCGTPALIGTELDIDPFITTACFLLPR